MGASAVDGEAERITYTQWLDPDGKLQADLTVTKLADRGSAQAVGIVTDIGLFLEGLARELVPGFTSS